MTKQEALQELMDLSIDYGTRTAEEIERLDEAVDMAIKALKVDALERPTCEDAVSRQTAIDAIERNAYRHTYIDQIVDIIKELPSAQPEIIACGDCKHWICHDRRCGYWNHGVKPLDWCCHAERRTDGSD